VPEAELIFSGGPVVTVDPQNRIAEAVAVRGDRIVNVGDAAGAAEWTGPRTRVVDLRGRTAAKEPQRTELMFYNAAGEVEEAPDK
jgi:predicted amidohydrolase YtcJ